MGFGKGGGTMKYYYQKTNDPSVYFAYTGDKLTGDYRVFLCAVARTKSGWIAFDHDTKVEGPTRDKAVDRYRQESSPITMERE